MNSEKKRVEQGLTHYRVCGRFMAELKTSGKI